MSYLGFSLMGAGGCRVAGGGHGTNGADFTKPGGVQGSLQACKDYCEADASCVAIEWETDEGSYGPKCEIWSVMPAFAEIKADHSCFVKQLAVPPPPRRPPSLPPPSAPPLAPPLAPPPSSAALVIGLGVGGGCLLLLLLAVVVVLIMRRGRASKA